MKPHTSHAHPGKSFGFHRELIRPPYLNPLEMVSSAMAKRVCDLIPESLAGQVCCVRPSSAADDDVYYYIRSQLCSQRSFLSGNWPHQPACRPLMRVDDDD